MDFVNEKDEVLGNLPKKEIYEKQLTHRIVHIFIFNNKGERALQLQSRQKSFCPLHWATSATGHVKSGETYEQAALRELEEEIGVKTTIDFLHKDLYEVRKGFTKFLSTFKTIYNGPFILKPDEVEKVEFFSLEEIQKMIKSGEKFHPELLFLLEKHFNIE